MPDETLPPDHPAVSRRSFLARASRGLAAAALAGEILPAAAGRAEEKADPLKLPEISARTEQQQGSTPELMPPEKRVGFAVVGLGHLALDQIIPAFGESKKARLAAVVSGDRAKAAQVAREHGLPEGSVYDYQTYDQMRDNPDVQVIYIVLPNGMHAEYTVRGAQAGKHILCEKPMANSVAECEQMIAACKKADKKSDDRLPHPVRAEQPADAKMGPRERSTARSKSSKAPTARTRATRTSGGKTRHSPAAARCRTWGCIA